MRLPRTKWQTTTFRHIEGAYCRQFVFDTSFHSFLVFWSKFAVLTLSGKRVSSRGTIESLVAMYHANTSPWTANDHNNTLCHFHVLKSTMSCAGSQAVGRCKGPEVSVVDQP